MQIVEVFMRINREMTKRKLMKTTTAVVAKINFVTYIIKYWKYNKNYNYNEHKVTKLTLFILDICCF